MNIDLLAQSHASLLTGRWITDLANTSAFLFEELSDLNWVGFYLREDDTLYLGPFQGKLACTEIQIGKGVCGLSAKLMETIIVSDVHKFEGHIACDSRSNSEIVVPLLKNGICIGVLDLDSPSLNRFNESDADFLKIISRQLVQSSWSATIS